VTNPYRPPGAVVADRDRPADSPIKGIIYGALVDVLGTTAASMILGVGYGIFLTANGASMEDLERLSAQIDPTSAIGLVGGAIGCGFSVLGGYVCARVAGRPELRWAAVVGAISAGFGLLMASQSPADLNLLLNGIGFAMVMLGGYLGARRNARLER
jgi:hypothetical protein